MGKDQRRQHSLIKQWLREGHSPTELLDPAIHVQGRLRKQGKKGEYDRFRIVPNKGSAKITNGGRCSPK